MVMTEMTVELPEEVLARVRRIANERGVELSTVLREAIEALPELVEVGIWPKPRNFGMFPSEQTDLSVRAGEESIVLEPWFS